MHGPTIGISYGRPNVRVNVCVTAFKGTNLSKAYNGVNELKFAL